MTYDIKKVNKAIVEIKKIDDKNLFILLLNMIEKDFIKTKYDYDILNKHFDKYEDLNDWEKANLLYRLAENAQNIVKRKAKYYEARARKEDKIEELENKIIYIEQNYHDGNNPLISDEEYDKLFKELRSLKPDSKVIKEFDNKFNNKFKEIKDDRKSET